MDYGGHRRRSNTAARLEKMRKERKNLEKQKTVPWKDNKDPSQFTRTSFFVDMMIYHGDLLQPDVTESHFRGSTWLLDTFSLDQQALHSLKCENFFLSSPLHRRRAGFSLSSESDQVFRWPFTKCQRGG